MSDKYLSVSTISRYIKHLLDTDKNLQTIFIKGEISNLKQHSSGHIYFSLKDETSKINAIMFSNNAKKLNFVPTDGTKVLAIGRVSLYEATGNYQIYINEMLEDGVGNLYIAFEKLKEKLSKEGLFQEKYKVLIPKYPAKIGVVTANTGAAIKDIISTIKRRYPIAEVYLFSSLVQGEQAKYDLVKKIEQADQFGVDVIIVGRGGGSIEDLWPFNEEIVAKAIFDCKTPIISAVGHEIDYTIADFVADLRAPTPTGAAEIAVPNIIDIISHLNHLKIRLNESILKNLNLKKLYFDSLRNSYIIKNPNFIYENKRQKLDLIETTLNSNILLKLENNKKEINNLLIQLDLLNPLNILKRGYSLTYKNKKIVKSIKNIKEKDNLTIKLSDGNINVVVRSVEDEI
ncbi:MAG: exodeoxyribonuclease VII large subunit [Candidatus Faecisoma sp.]|nr:exodeoxyribonuclease VII large subunit [Acholeplasma sp.]MDY2892184.1 exodeoxyribonuclease VII large subunit [Candidatus Faecisoma sp.]